MLTLTLSGITLTLTQFRPGGYSRLPVQDQRGRINYSLSGAALVSGPGQEEKHEWVVQALVTESQRASFERIAREQSRLRYTAPYSGYEILLFDQVRPIWDKPGVKRLVVPSTLTQAIDGGVSYYAAFHCLILTHQFQQEGVLWGLDFTLTELGRVT